MIDHTGFTVSDLTRSKAFYIAALKPLDITPIIEVTAEQTGAGAHAGFGTGGKPFFWIGEGGPVATDIHIAFAAGSRDAVDAFYKAALGAGGTDNGGPGVRPHYHANYYGAFVRDPDGNNIEAVCHAPV